MKFDFLGGASEIGGSSILLRMDDKNILLDSGIRQAANRDPLPDFRTIQETGGLDAIIISHAHLDHIGSLPLISKEYPGARIYMNPMTKALVRVQLYDSIKVMKNREAEIPLYAEQDVVEVLDRIVTIGYQTEFAVADGINLTFYHAGHIAGASFCYLQGKEGSVFYSGDFSVFAQRSIEGAKLPALRPDAAILESTYGDRLHSNREVEEKALIRLVNEAVENNGKVLIPAFALGRAQEVILILKSAMNKGSLKKVKVYVDGMVRDINRAYASQPLYLKRSLGKKALKGLELFYDENIVEVTPTMKREELVNEKEAVVFVASSGMLTGGPSSFYAEKISAMENGCIAITGYQDEESPGRHLLELKEEKEGERYLKLNGLSFPVKCRITKIGLSAHSDKSEIRSVIEKLAARNVILVHGNEEVVKSLGREIAVNYRGRVYAPECGEHIDIMVRNPRKQLKKELPYTMNKKEELTAERIGLLYDYVSEHYFQRLLTVEELYYIWHGVKENDEECLEMFHKTIQTSAYFENDSKRLFLLKTRERNAVLLDLQPKELTQQQLVAIVEERFHFCSYKKISILNESRTIRLMFDFPDAVDESVRSLFSSFEEETGWKLSLNDMINNSAAEIMIRSYFNNAAIDKISFFSQEKRIDIIVNHNLDATRLEQVCENFKQQTGWILGVNPVNTMSSGSKTDGKDYFRTNNKASLEQNEALYLIDLAFEELPHKPYKKSIRQNGQCRTIELSFITPALGRRYAKELEEISGQVGWDIAISGKINQNELINKALLLCRKYQVTTKKTPSYLPDNGKIKLNITGGQEYFTRIKEEYLEETGGELEP